MADNASDNRQAATSQRERVGGKFKTKQTKQNRVLIQYMHIDINMMQVKKMMAK